MMMYIYNQLIDNEIRDHQIKIGFNPEFELNPKFGFNPKSGSARNRIQPEIGFNPKFGFNPKSSSTRNRVQPEFEPTSGTN